MARPKADDYLRVKDKDTGYHLTVLRAAFDASTMQELKQTAVDHNGNPLEPDYTKAPSSQSGHQATTTKE